MRQEKALQRYDNTESEISQLLAHHSNEIHVLRERFRRTQERERAAERRSKDSEEQLQRSQATIARLKKLVDQRELGVRDELSRRLEEEKSRTQEAEQKIRVNSSSGSLLIRFMVISGWFSLLMCLVKMYCNYKTSLTTGRNYMACIITIIISLSCIILCYQRYFI